MLLPFKSIFGRPSQIVIAGTVFRSTVGCAPGLQKSAGVIIEEVIGFTFVTLCTAADTIRILSADNQFRNNLPTRCNVNADIIFQVRTDTAAFDNSCRISLFRPISIIHNIAPLFLRIVDHCRRRCTIDIGKNIAPAVEQRFFPISTIGIEVHVDRQIVQQVDRRISPDIQPIGVCVLYQTIVFQIINRQSKTCQVATAGNGYGMALHRTVLKQPIRPIRIRIVDRIRMIAGCVNRFLGINRISTDIQIGCIHHLHITGAIDKFRQISGLLQTHITIIRNVYLARHTSFRLYYDNAVSSTSTIDGSCGSIFQNRDTLNRIRIQLIHVHRNAIDQHQRVVIGFQRRNTTDLNRGSIGTRQTGSLRYIQTCDAALQRLGKRSNRLRRHVFRNIQRGN